MPGLPEPSRTRIFSPRWVRCSICTRSGPSTPTGGGARAQCRRGTGSTIRRILQAVGAPHLWDTFRPAQRAYLIVGGLNLALLIHHTHRTVLATETQPRCGSRRPVNTALSFGVAPGRMRFIKGGFQ